MGEGEGGRGDVGGGSRRIGWEMKERCRGVGGRGKMGAGWEIGGGGGGRGLPRGPGKGGPGIDTV